MSNTKELNKQDHAATSTGAQKSIEINKTAAKHHEEAAKHHNDAVKHHEVGDPEKAGESTTKAKDHHALAGKQYEEMSKHTASSAKK